jgi:hypothetical protein
VCDAERNGRFCEECGYDFDLAEAMPQVTMNPGVGPTQPQQVAPPFPAPEAPTSSAGSTSFAGSTSVSGAQAASSAAAPSGSEGETSGGGTDGGQGFDLDAELARAEAEAAAAFAATSEAAAAVPQQAQPVELASEAESAGSAPSMSASTGVGGPVPEVESAQAPDTTLAEELQPVVEAAPGLVMFSASSSQVLGEELSVVVNADLDYYKAQVERGDIIESEFPFPKYPAERRFSFVDGPVRIGRASARRGLVPEIDLTGPPLDPAVSHLHAQLLRHPEGWVVVDLGSANGTRLNDSAEPLEAETEIPVRTGDRIHLGVWTTIMIQ